MKKLILIEDNSSVYTTLIPILSAKGFDIIHFEYSQDYQDDLAKLDGISNNSEVVIVCDYKDDNYTGTFTSLARDVLNRLKEKNVKVKFILNSADSNPELKKELSEFTDVDFEVVKVAKNGLSIIEAIDLKDRELQKILA